ncbi:MAG: VanZ family protein [Paludibacter sp.]|nr:VanZ family protein [Paludibacter sp.]
MKFISFIRSYWKSIVFTAIILYLSFAPPSTFNGVPSFPNEDKLVHIFLYTCLTILLIFDFIRYKKSTDNKLSYILFCLLLPVILGGLVEILQPMYFAPRTAEWLDWFSDITGVFMGWTATKLLRKLNIRI